MAGAGWRTQAGARSGRANGGLNQAPISSTAGTGRSSSTGSVRGSYARSTVRKRGCSTETRRNSRQALPMGKLAATKLSKNEIPGC